MSSSFAPAEIFCVPLGASIDPTSVLHKRRQLVAGFLDPLHIPQCPRPFADCFVVCLAIACTTDHGGKRVRIHISPQPGKLVRTPHELFGLSSPVAMFDNR